MRSRWGWMVVATLLAPGAGSAAVPNGTVFVGPVKSDIDLKGLDRQIADGIAEALKGRKAYPVVTSSDVEDMLAAEAKKSAVNCQDDEECLAKIQNATEADYLVSTTVGRVGREMLLTISLMSTADGRVLGREATNATTVPNALAQLPAQLGRLFGYGEGPAVKYEMPESTGKIRIGVFGIQSAGVPEDDVKNLAEFVIVELSKVNGAEIINPSAIEAMIGKATYDDAFGSDCAEECLARISGSLNVKYLVTGQVGSFGGLADEEEEEQSSVREYVVSLKLINQEDVRVENLRTVAFRGPKEELKRAVRTVARELVGVSTKLPGKIAVTGPVSGADVIVGESPVGESPVKLENEYAPGRLELRLEKDGYYTWASDVFVQPGEENLVWAELKERPSPWYTRWWVWAIVGGVAAAGTTTAVLVLNQPPETGSGVVTIR